MYKLVVAVVLMVSGCGAIGDTATGGAAVGAADDAIQAGARDAKDAAVGVVWIHGGGFCTGTLIAPDVVLTAGHCVESRVDGFYTGTGKGTDQVGLLPTGGLVGHRVIDQIAHPSYVSKNVCPNSTFDVALLRLAKPITATAPIPLATRPPVVGTVCTAVGYGVHDNADGSVTVEQRRKGTESVMGVGKSYVHITMGTGVVDHGDSGGPLLCNGHISGTTSCGNDGVWPDHQEAYYGRVDSIAAWVASTVTGWK